MQHFIRKYLINVAGPILGLLVLFTSLISCSGGEEAAIRERSSLGKVLKAQIEASCNTPISQFSKEIVNLAVDPNTKEDSTWSIWPLVPAGETEDGRDSVQCVLFLELEWAMKTIHDAPSIIDYYGISAKGDTVLAQIKSSSANQSDLKAQKYLLDDRQEKILYWKSEYSKENWLYGLDVMVEIFFDNEGRYTHHNLKVQNEVSLMNSGFHAWVMGKAIYHE
ncbi:MAG: hypothetical protein AB8H47_01620 [Bacteroidia bacterium]